MEGQETFKQLLKFMVEEMVGMLEGLKFFEEELAEVEVDTLKKDEDRNS